MLNKTQTKKPDIETNSQHPIKKLAAMLLLNPAVAIYHGFCSQKMMC
jgi:hypothetical protein